MKRSTRITIIASVAFLAMVVLFFVPSIPQPLEYHDFADQRSLRGMPHALNVFSNLPFMLVGATALWTLLRHRKPTDRSIFLERREQWPWVCLFSGVLLLGLGSAAYHWNPSNETLAWDRLPIAWISSSLLAAVISERISVAAGLRWLIPLLAVSLLSVGYWLWTENRGAGDLRLYGAIQFLPILLIPLLLLLFPPRYTGTGNYVAALGWYVLARLAEAWDASIYAFGNVISGHTLKHLFAALALYWLYLMLGRRSPVPHLRASASRRSNT